MKINKTSIKTILNNKFIITLSEEQLAKLKGGTIHVGAKSNIDED